MKIMELIGNIQLAESRGTLEGYAKPQDRSVQDGTDFKYKDKRLSLWKARYSYAPKRNSKNSRDFCVKMVSIAQSGLVYRKEDIIQMGDDGINSELAPSGKTNYSIWLFKGGAVCHHYWERHIYVRKWNAIQIPAWINLIADLPIPTLDSKYSQLAAFLLINTTGLPLESRKRMFANIIDFKGFVESSARGYFQRYMMNLDIPAPLKTIIFQRFGKDINGLIQFFNGLLRGRPFPKEKISKRMARIPVTSGQLDWKQSGELFDALLRVTKGITSGNDRKLGIPKSSSKTNKLENEDEIGAREARRRGIKYPENNILVGTKPVNMPDRGYMSGRARIRRQAIARAIKKLI